MPAQRGRSRIAAVLLVILGSWLVQGCVARERANHAWSSNAHGRTASPVCAPLRAGGTQPTIDDFQTSRPTILRNEGRGGWWFVYDDGSGGHLVREVVELNTGSKKSHALHVTSSGYETWGAGFGFNLHPQGTRTRACTYDASVYQGLRFRARGHGRLRIDIGQPSTILPAFGGTCARESHACYDRPGMWVSLDNEWRSFEFPFCALLPEGWGGSKETVDPSKIVGVYFRTDAREDLELWLDELSFYRAKDGDPQPHCGRSCPLDLVPSTARIDPMFLMGPTAPGLSVHTFEQTTTSCGAITRRYLSYVPSRLSRRSNAPVLMMLHGSGANAESARTFQARNRFDALAERDGFIVVYGNAAPGAHTSPDPKFPNTGVWRHGLFEDAQVDDVEYLMQVIDDLTKRDVILGGNPVFLTGISNGGGMALSSVRRTPNSFLGAAVFMPYDGENPRPVPPTNLKRLLFAYGIEDPGLPAGYHTVLSQQPANWALAMGLSAAVIQAPKKTVLPNVVAEGSSYGGDNKVALSTRNSHVTEFDFSSQESPSRLRVLVFEHAGHFWPNPIEDAQDWVLNRWGFRNQDFDAADMVWEFLKAALDAPTLGQAH